MNDPMSLSVLPFLFFLFVWAFVCLVSTDSELTKLQASYIPVPVLNNSPSLANLPGSRTSSRDCLTRSSARDT